MSVRKLSIRSARIDRQRQQFGRHRQCHLVAIGVDLDAEGTADIAGDDADIFLRHLEMLGEDGLHHVGRLAGIVECQRFFCRVKLHHRGARLERNARMTAKPESTFHHKIALVIKSGVDIACLDKTFPGKIGIKIYVNALRIRIKRLRCVGQRLPDGIFDSDDFNGIFGFRAGLSDNHHNRFALPAHPANRQRILFFRTDHRQDGSTPT